MLQKCTCAGVGKWRCTAPSTGLYKATSDGHAGVRTVVKCMYTRWLQVLGVAAFRLRERARQTRPLHRGSMCAAEAAVSTNSRRLTKEASSQPYTSWCGGGCCLSAPPQQRHAVHCRHPVLLLKALPALLERRTLPWLAPHKLHPSAIVSPSVATCCADWSRPCWSKPCCTAQRCCWARKSPQGISTYNKLVVYALENTM